MPDESLFKNHLGEAFFLIGVDDGRWGLHGSIDDIQWPYVILWCKATPRGDGHNKYYFRFDLKGYSAEAPTAVPWDIAKNVTLAAETWPRWSEQLKKVFNHGWNGGSALYAPCDRVAMKGHTDWPQKHPAYWWTSGSRIDKYLGFLVRILNGHEG